MPKIVDHAQRRLVIAKAASKVVAKRGLEATKLTDIAKIAGVTTGAITHYFEDKDSVLLAALEMAYDTMFTDMEKVAQQPDYSFYDIMAQSMPLTPENTESMAVWLAFWSRSLAIPKVSEQQMRFHIRWMNTVKTELLRHYEMHQKPIPVDLDDFAEEITAQINGLIIRGVVDKKAWPEERLRKVLKNYLKRIDLYE